MTFEKRILIAVTAKTDNEENGDKSLIIDFNHPSPEKSFGKVATEEKTNNEANGRHRVNSTSILREP